MTEFDKYVPVVLDSEFIPQIAEAPNVLCFVAKNLRTGETKRIWKDQFNQFKNKPLFDTNEIWITYSAMAELHAAAAAKMALPNQLIDLMVERRNEINGTDLEQMPSLLSSCDAYRIPHMGGYRKDIMRNLILSGGPYVASQVEEILNYCGEDVLLTERLFMAMKSRINLEQAIFRGHHLKSCFEVERNGIPIDVQKYKQIHEMRDSIREKLIKEVDAGFGFFEEGVFKISKFSEWLLKKDIAWPTTEKGNLMTDDQTFKDMSRVHTELQDVRELKNFLAVTRRSSLAIGSDGKNRTDLRPFSSKTGRNQPSSTEAIFGNASWNRALIKPNLGFSLVYLDYKQQEFGIGAALSNDPNKKASYQSGDPYLEFAKLAKAVPSNATKSSHKKERERFKLCALAVQYGMSAHQLAINANISQFAAKELLQLHRTVYKKYWSWSDAVVNHYTLKGFIETRFGWRLNYKPGFNERSVRNFLMQANGSEILRVALRLLLDRGIKVCASIHDAVLIESVEGNVDTDILTTQDLMSRAAAIVLDGFDLGTDVKVVKFPDRYIDERGRKMWETIDRLLCAE